MATHTTERSFSYMLWFLYLARTYDTACCTFHRLISYENLLVMKELFDREVESSCRTRSGG